jgi:DNA-directed RNA polymerase subunit RPC12/RpoP
MELPWKFCPHCGAAHAPETHEAAVAVVFEKAPVQGAFGGLLFGMLVVPILVIVGTMLCLTGLGAVLGIPMILAAVFAPLAGPMIGLGALKGKCPWCGTQVSSIGTTKEFGCHACKGRIVITHREFVRAN